MKHLIILLMLWMGLITAVYIVEAAKLNNTHYLAGNIKGLRIPP